MLSVGCVAHTHLGWRLKTLFERRDALKKGYLIYDQSNGVWSALHATLLLVLQDSNAWAGVVLLCEGPHGLLPL